MYIYASASTTHDKMQLSSNPNEWMLLLNGYEYIKVHIQTHKYTYYVPLCKYELMFECDDWAM